MRTASQVSLKPYNTFGIDARVEKLITLENADEINKIIEEHPGLIVIGGGSNILLSREEYDVVLLNRIKGIEVVEETPNQVIVGAGSGVNWHELVLWTLSKGYGGLENLSLIPGTVGAAPIQNIGAYGVELKDVLHGLNYFNYENSNHSFVAAEECKFGYRDSIFKNEWKNKGFISQVFIRLTRYHHNLNTEYKALRNYLNENGGSNPTIHQISEAVIAIRQSKLPDWREIGNAGSFFKNPVISKAIFESLKENHPGIPSYPVDDQQVKVPAAWLIQETGYKGKKIGRVGSYQYQPLVLINYGGAKASELMHLKDNIQSSVRKKFEIELIPEVTIL